MATIVTRETGATAKGSPLTNAELDNNFININTELGTKLPLSGGSMSNTNLVTNLNADLFDGQHRRIDLTDFTTWDGAKVGPVSWYNFTGGPSVGSFHTGIRLVLSDTAYGAELAVKHDADQIWFRRVSASTFQSWKELVHNGNYSTIIDYNTILNAPSQLARSFMFMGS